jgi:hypothetical protein
LILFKETHFDQVIVPTEVSLKLAEIKELYGQLRVGEKAFSPKAEG